jgi:endo-1,3(4)-beta-glucanase
MMSVAVAYRRMCTNKRRKRAGTLAVAALVMGLVATSSTACTSQDPPPVRDEEGVTEGYAGTPIVAPSPAGKGNVAASLPVGARPGKTPVQAGREIADRALPTSQWWTSALTGPLTEQLWAFPLALKVADAGINISSTNPVASANAVVTPFRPAITAGGPVASVEVISYGAFHVVLRATLRSGGSVEVTLVQGSPVLYLHFTDVAPTLRLTGAVTPIDRSAVPRAATLRLDIAGQRWDLLAPDGAHWRSDVDSVTADQARDGRIAVARVPDGADPAQWDAAIADAAADPVTRTKAATAYEATTGTVTQTLTTVRASGAPGVWALLPHQRAGLVTDDTVTDLAGSYPNIRGALSLVRAGAVRVRVALPGLLSTVPTIALPAAARTAVVADLNRDLADQAPGGGSYFGQKELSRLATIAEVAKAVAAGPQRQAALDRLRPQLVDWLTYSGDNDGRYFGYDPSWGGLIAVPAEFGSNDYNDHHFQYGYLVRAAAVLAEADPDFLTAYGPTVDLVVREYSGALAGWAPPDGAVAGGATAGGGGFPPFRVFNAYLGNSAASGFANFADGNNQESSSEAVAAWEAVVRWGLVSHNAPLTSYGLGHYALEAATARRYWLGEGMTHPSEYRHRGVGIVWDAKLDYATWFDAKPESIQGIQLLPLTFGSLYRADPAAAAARATTLAAEIGGPPRAWGDLFAADLALAHPGAAQARLTPALSREESTSRGLVRYLVETLAALGPPQPGVSADGPYGLAFGSLDYPTLAAVNPTRERRTVTFRRDGTVIAQLTLDPGQSQTSRPAR